MTPPAAATVPSVAIVIPTYNRADFLPAAVDSALAQTVPCRVIVVDDGSKDNTEAVAAAYGDRITYVNQANSERGAARNHGALLAGDVDYLAFLDSDDLLTPDHVARLIEPLERDRRAPFAAPRILVVDAQARPLYPVGARPGDHDLERFLVGGASAGSFSLIRRSAFDAVGGFDPDRALSGSEDWLFFARLLTLGHGKRGDGCTAHYRLHGGNSVHDARSMGRTMLEAHRRFFDGDLGAPYARWRAPSRARILVGSAINWYAAEKFPGARLLPGTIEGRASVQRWLFFQAAHVTPACLLVARATNASVMAFWQIKSDPQAADAQGAGALPAGVCSRRWSHRAAPSSPPRASTATPSSPPRGSCPASRPSPAGSSRAGQRCCVARFSSGRAELDRIGK